MSLNDVDPYYIKSISALHSYDYLNGEPCSLQMYLEEAIKNKSGANKDLTPLVSTAIKQNRLEEFKPQLNVIEESKTTSSSDNELRELMDLMCIVCNKMDVGARNRLLECGECHALYHQECHCPPVTSLELDETWICQKCKENRLKESPMSPVSMSPTRAASPVPSTSKHSNMKSSVPPMRNSTSPLLYKNENSKSSQVAWAKACNKIPPSGRSPSSVISTSSSSMKNSMTPNINIISADKRIQIMKKKAAKLQEKRKLPR